MRMIRRTGVRLGLVLASLAFGLATVATASAAASSKPPYEVEFDSTTVNQFAGQDNEPQGAETTEIQAEIPLAKSGSGTYTGSALSSYKQASGTITETCTSGDTTGTTEEIEESGHATTFSAEYTPGAGGTGGTVEVDLGPFSGGLEETFEDIPGCGGPTEGNTTPRFLADFTSDHQSQLSIDLSNPGEEFSFTLTPGASLGGPTSYAGTYDYTGGSSNGNLTYTENTSIDVFANNCVVPNVVGKSQAAAESALTDAGCTVGAVSSASSDEPAGTVISSDPGAGTKLDPDSAVALVVSKGETGDNGQGGKGKTCKVPNLKGDSLATAKSKLKGAGCAVGKVKHKKSSKQDRHRVISQSPHSGSKEKAGSKVGLTIGK